MNDIDRRSAIVLGAAGLAAPSLAATKGVAAAPRAFREDYVPPPLPVDPAKLTGLSERLIRSHWDNNYMGSVKALNMIAGRLKAALADTSLPPIVHGGLKREYLNRTNSVVLHELYFAGLGGDGKAGGGIAVALASAFGSFAAWEADFRRTAMALAGGSGWCILGWNPHFGTLENHWAPDHMHSAAASVPLLALDMYEHSFAIDYGAAAAKYVDAFMANVNWETVDRRYAEARA
ncbi:superoxide dismutase [Sphingomonas sp. SUN039]|uniref:superoxide dismutase n=1 Tax=Sphingomonas sp. SUN039 TaxID=2937787 RepID=UPI002164AE0B|nr:Fe-Mn family superoxide dismutase [Sphingomonas sp. SUN039]UVO53201.1 Fe-Mn family superoxide dismutase [Sphingomonas sp. SUN039]